MNRCQDNSFHHETGIFAQNEDMYNTSCVHYQQGRTIYMNMTVTPQRHGTLLLYTLIYHKPGSVPRAQGAQTHVPDTCH